MFYRNRELWLAFLAVLLITGLYLVVTFWFEAIPAAQGFFGHMLGITGYILMILTETLYSLRKRSRSARWGRMASWLQLHIFTGLVGPYMVLLHSSWKFNGLAGVVFLLTVVIVISGFVGRYIYTAVPRTADGAELQARELNDRIQIVESQISTWLAAQPNAGQALSQYMNAALAPRNSNSSLSLTHLITDLDSWFTWQREQYKLSPAVRAHAGRLKELIDQERQLRRQMNSLAAARRLLAVWHTVHIPIGVVLFTTSLIHITAAVYYATLLH